MRKNRPLLLLLPAFLVLLALVLAGCKDFSFYGVLGDRIDDTPLQIAPPAASVAEVSGLLNFSATGGMPPYSYSVIPGTGTGSIVAATGAFTAGTVGDLTVRVTDSKGRASNALITVTATGAILAISPVNIGLSLGGGLTFVASGGTPPYTFSLTSTGSGSPTINVPLNGDYVAGLTPGIDTIQVQDGASDTAIATVNVSAATPTVDYSLAGFSVPSPVKGGSLVSGATFHVANGGIADGVEDIYYWVYLSDDGTLGSGDALLDAGSTGALAMGPGTDVGINGTWPLSSGAKNLIVVISAVDDLNVANNVGAAVPVTLELPDYQGTLTHDAGTTAGAAFTGTLAIDNIGTADGSQDVSWSVYASLGNATIDTDDKIVASGSIPGGIGAAAAPAVIPIANTWPAVAAPDYWLVAVISAADEIDAAGNQPSDGPVAVAAAPAPAVDYSGALSNPPAPRRAGGSFSATISINNGPAAGSSTVYWSVYASLGDTVIDAGDKLVASGSIPGGLPASGSFGPYLFSNTWPSAIGDYYLLADIQADDETAPANNRPSSAVLAVGVTDYSGVVTHTGGTTAGAAFTGTLTVSNVGGPYALAGSQNLYWNVYASLDLAIGADDKVVGSGMIAGGLGAGANSGLMLFGNTWPSTAGTYYLIADLFAGDDAGTGNNRPDSGPITVNAPPAANVNYGGAVAHSTGFTAGAGFTGTVTVTNGGTTAGTQPVNWYVYASLGNSTIDAGDKLVASGTIPGGLAASDSTGALGIGNTWPSTAGTYYLVADIQAADDVNLIDNQPASGALVVNAPPVDYSGSLTVPAPLRAGGSFNANITIANGPAAGGSSTVHWSVYASPGNATIEAGDKLVASGSIPGGLPASGSFGPYLFSNTWPSATGDYYLVADIQAADDINNANNTPASAVVAVGATDYSGAVAHAGGSLAGAAFTGTLNISNVGGAYALGGSQDLYWNVYASLDLAIGADDKVVDSGMIAGGLGAGGSTGLMIFANTWPSTAGTYYLIAELYAGDDAVLGNNQVISGAVAVTLANVNYGGAVANTGGTTAGAGLNGTITVTNGGSDNGAQDVVWQVYASLGNASIDAGDKLVASGSIPGGLPGSGGSTGPVGFANTWPAAAGSYYLVVDIQAADDVNLANNQPNSGAIPVNAPAVDYFGSVSGTPTLRAGGSFNATISVNNGPAAAGSSTVYWYVYASLGDTTIDAGDKLLASGSIPGGLPASGTFGPYLYTNTWPLATGDYYLVADIQAADDVNTANNRPFTGPLAVGATDYSGTVTHLSGTTAGAGFTFSLDINNIAGPYALPGSQDLYWNVYASLGNTIISADDKVVDSGFIAGGLPAGGNHNSGVRANTWPSAPGLYYLIMEIFAGDDANTADNRPNDTVTVIAPLPPDYAVSFQTPPPWSAIVGTAIGGQVRIQNISANNGLQPINYSIYRSADKVPGGDVLLVSGSLPAINAGAFVDIPVADGDLWPATGQFCFLIAVISAADDAAMGNNTVVGHPTAVANVRYVEGVEDNDDSGPTPPAFSNVSITGQILTLNGTLAIEGTMDPYQGALSTYDTYRFLTGAGVGGISMKARWDTGFDDIDIYLWSASGGEVSNIDTDLDSEPAGVPDLSIIGITASTNYFAGVNFWLANDTSGSAGRPYVLLLTGNPP